MKGIKWGSLVAAVVMCLLMTAGCSFFDNGLNYSWVKDDEGNWGYCVVGIGDCTDTEIKIPSTHDGEPVIAIGANAFSSRTFYVEPSTSSGGLEGLVWPQEKILPNETCKSIKIPACVTDIHPLAFSGCTALERIEIDEDNPKYHVVDNCVIETSTKTLTAICSTSVIPTDGSVTAIGEGVFTGRTEMTEFWLPDSVTKIGDSAFSYCSGLTEVVVPETVTEIGDAAFSGCTGMTSIILPETVTEISDAMFLGCTALTDITIPDGVTKIGDSAFSNCTALTGIAIPKAVTEISNSMFSGCTALTDITIPDGVTKIGDSAFSNCTALTGITIPDGVTEIGNSAFSSCTALTGIVIPNRLRSIGIKVFYNCSELTSITAAEDSLWYRCEGNCLIERDQVTERAQVIAGCKTSVIPTDGSVIRIGDYAFSGCTGLTSIPIPDSVTAIGSSAFSECTGLTNIVIPRNVEIIGENPFERCTGIKITVASDNQNFYVAGNCLISRAGKLISGFDNSTIPTDGSVNIIGESAFSGCTGLTTVVIPDGVTAIEMFAFSGCTQLASVTIPSTVRAIGEDIKISSGVSSGITINGDYSSYLVPSDSGNYSVTWDITGDDPSGYISFGHIATLTPGFSGSDGVLSYVRLFNSDPVFSGCFNLNDIVFLGTQEQWKAIGHSFGFGKTIHCSDGDIDSSDGFREYIVSGTVE